jgi:hypothetical protein
MAESGFNLFERLNKPGMKLAYVIHVQSTDRLNLTHIEYEPLLSLIFTKRKKLKQGDPL